MHQAPQVLEPGHWLYVLKSRYRCVVRNSCVRKVRFYFTNLTKSVSHDPFALFLGTRLVIILQLIVYIEWSVFSTASYSVLHTHHKNHLHYFTVDFRRAQRAYRLYVSKHRRHVVWVVRVHDGWWVKMFFENPWFS